MIGVISDVHGNYPALKAVLERLDAAGCDRIISLGDVSGYYCMINECINVLRERSVINIMGNHDFYISSDEKCQRSYTVNECLAYQKKVLTEKNFEWIKGSVPYIREYDRWFVHGGWNDFVDEYVTDFSFLDVESDVTLFVSGHTHIQKLVEGRAAVYMNPGAVGQPRDGAPAAAYAIIDEEGRVHLGRTEYDIDRIAFEMKQAGFQERVASCLYYGVRIGEDGK